MAVWMQIIGFRESNSLEKEKELISNILNSENLNWSIKKRKNLEFFEFTFIDQQLKIYFDNPNFIEFSGTSSIFTAWYKFVDTENTELTNKVKKVFSQIANKRGIQKLYYFSEWFFSLDQIRLEEENFEQLIERIKNYPDLKKTELLGLEANEYYMEKI
ncbi:hypothetical protein [uncultured Aquimarina sp.]|uniref:hypothetical protein n=1 Tax=uncultured Aquimarina sp. TaxID=575652 RepID=UPI002606EE8A|nr:hypothetical protein [uncultured Aquimarina sp.]